MIRVLALLQASGLASDISLPRAVLRATGLNGICQLPDLGYIIHIVTILARDRKLPQPGHKLCNGFTFALFCNGEIRVC